MSPRRVANQAQAGAVPGLRTGGAAGLDPCQELAEPRRCAPWDRRGSGARGAVIVEAALILPIFFMIIFGMLEIGGALKSYSSVANGVRAGGRMASVAGNDAMADQMVLQRLAQETAGIGKGEVEYVLIWKASGPGTSPPAGCLQATPASPNQQSQGVVGTCNIYFRPQASGGAFDMAAGRATQPASYYFGCSGLADPQLPQKVDCNWPGQDRKVTNSPRGALPVLKTDYAGVYVKAAHQYYTGILGSTLTITDAGINLLEPQGYDP